MSDDRLRWELTALGFTPGPITDTTRDVLKRKLHQLRTESMYRRSTNGGGSNGNGAVGADHDNGHYEEGEEVYDETLIDNGDYWNAHGSSLLAGGAGPTRRAVQRRSWGPSAAPREVVGAGRSGPLNTLPLRWSVGAPSRDHGPQRAPPYGADSLRSADYVSRLPSEVGTGRLVAENRALYRSPYQVDNYSTYDSLAARREEPSVSARDGGSVRQRKPSWTRNLEYYLSRLLWGLSVVLVLVFIGMLVVKSGMLNAPQESKINQLSVDCEGKDDQFCKDNEKKITFQILSELFDFLSLEAGRFDCGNPTGLKSKCIPIITARAHVTNISGHPPQKFDAALEWVLKSNKHFGIWVKGDTTETVTTRERASCVESSRPRLGILCRLKNAFCTVLSTMFLAVFGILLLWLVVVFLRYHWRKLEEEEKQMFEMVEKIIDAVKSHYREFIQRTEDSPYVGIVHVRDTLIPPQDRKRLKKVWERAVQFVENHESRLRTESQRVAGADLRVWRWTPVLSEYSGITSAQNL
ncbi:LEM domain-containing 2 [Pelobates cultripes]|nr:LEM domain-containing 2 [Pelobates cultripes]